MKNIPFILGFTLLIFLFISPKANASCWVDIGLRAHPENEANVVVLDYMREAVKSQVKIKGGLWIALEKKCDASRIELQPGGQTVLTCKLDFSCTKMRRYRFWVNGVYDEYAPGYYRYFPGKEEWTDDTDFEIRGIKDPLSR